VSLQDSGQRPEEHAWGPMTRDQAYEVGGNGMRAFHSHRAFDTTPVRSSLRQGDTDADLALEQDEEVGEAFARLWVALQE
jgi:hypothetical protein